MLQFIGQTRYFEESNERRTERDAVQSRIVYIEKTLKNLAFELASHPERRKLDLQIRNFKKELELLRKKLNELW